MTTPVWPTSLPQAMTMDSFTEAMGDGRLRSPTDTGPGKVRRRFSAVARPVAGTMVMTQTQLETMLAFITDDLSGGSLAFEFPNQRGSTAWLVRIADEMPGFRRVANGHWSVDLKLEILP